MMLEKMEKEYPGVDLKKEDIDMCHRLVQESQRETKASNRAIGI